MLRFSVFKLGSLERLLTMFAPTQSSLEPYIRKRQEVQRIRRILTAHLNAHVGFGAASKISQPMSLIETTATIESSSGGVKGARRDYLRSLKANVRARQEYDHVLKEHQSMSCPDSQSTRDIDLGSSMLTFLDLVRIRRKHDRLRIVQNYVDGLSQKPAATTKYLDVSTVLKDAGSIPKVPQEILDASASRRYPEKTDFKLLVERLEQTVLHSKLFLRREQKLLAKLMVNSSSLGLSTGAMIGRLQALGTTRNELINWIETELSKASDSGQDLEEGYSFEAHGVTGREYIEKQLNIVQRQYSFYTKARQSLVATASSAPDAIISTPVRDVLGSHPVKDQASNSSSVGNTLHPYFEELAAISNEQKSIIRQKSHLTTSLAKHRKEASQGLSRLADESHLLPVHPMPPITSQGREMASFEEDISNQETYDSSRRAKPWVFASKAANVLTKGDVSEKLNEGRAVIGDAQETLSELHRLLGRDNDGGAKDIWEGLDVNLGVIKSND